jgi:predicted RecA/RadA family phage recombinase
MRSYDTPGVNITLDIPEADWAKYSSADLNVQIGDFVGITDGPVDRTDGKLVLAVERVFNRTVTSAAAAKIGAKVYLKADGTLSTTQADGVLFGRTLDAIAAGATATVRVKLIG